MLDTNVVSEIIRADALDKTLQTIAPAAILISSITEAELRYGIAKKPGATKIQKLVKAFLSAVDVVPFDADAAYSYGELRAQYEAAGLSVGALDGLIAAHARATGSILVTRDLAFSRLKQWVSLERW